MPFLRQSYKQKPAAYGPPSVVQASIFKNAERAGIAPALLWRYFPHWEGAGSIVQDYVANLRPTVALSTWSQGDLAFSDQNGQGYNSGFFDIQNGKDFFIFLQGVRVYAAGGATNAIAFYHSGNGYTITFRAVDWATTFRVTLTSNFSSTTLNDSPEAGYYNYALVRRNGQNIELYRNGMLVQTGTRAGTLTFPVHSTFIGYGDYNGKIGSVLAGYQAPTAAQIAYLSDNPYFLLPRVAPVFYSVPGGAITITTSLDGKVIIRTTTSALLDCMASIKNNASNILDGAAVVFTTESDAVDGKTILKSVAASVFDSKTSVLSVASLLLDGKGIIKSANSDILDGKSIFLSTLTPVIDGKIIINSEGFSNALLDGKTSIKSVATNYLDGLIYIGNAADKNIDGKAIIKSSVGLTIDGKTTIQDVASNLLDGSASILTSIANIVDGKIVISDAAIGLLDGEAVILDDSSIILDGKVFLSSGSEINIFDGKITLSVPIVGKVTVTFSMLSPSVSFSMKTPAATFSIN